MRDYIDRRITSPIWGTPPPCKQALLVTQIKRIDWSWVWWKGNEFYKGTFHEGSDKKAYTYLNNK